MLRPLHTSILTCLVAFALLIAGAEASLAPQDEGAPPPPQEEADDPPPLSVEDQEIAEEAGEAEEREIVSESAALEARLRSILDATDLFDGIEVASTRAGIVVLDGMATSRTAADAAVELAGDIDGVLLVVDEIEVDVRLLSRVKNSWRSASERFVSGLAALPLVAIALLIVGCGYAPGRLLAAATPIYALITERVLVQNLLRQSVLAFAVIASIFAALRFLEATALLGTVLGAAGVVGIAFGFAFRDVVENYLSGILLAIRRPFFAKDFIEVDGPHRPVDLDEVLREERPADREQDPRQVVLDDVAESEAEGDSDDA
ncbi:MAG: BON domain-containing protein, partial [Planctomycetota bacterium]